MKSIEQIEQDLACDKFDMCEKINMHIKLNGLDKTIRQHKLGYQTMRNIQYFDKKLQVETVIRIYRKIFDK